MVHFHRTIHPQDCYDGHWSPGEDWNHSNVGPEGQLSRLSLPATGHSTSKFTLCKVPMDHEGGMDQEGIHYSSQQSVARIHIRRVCASDALGDVWRKNL